MATESLIEVLASSSFRLGFKESTYGQTVMRLKYLKG
jgi:hypothetical protein